MQQLLLLTLLSIHMVYSMETSATYINTPIQKPSGIYYEYLQPVNFYENSWDIISYLDLDIFEDKLTFLENTFSRMIQYCQNSIVSELSICKTNVKLLNQLIPSIFQKERNLKTLIGHINKRQKKRITQHSWLSIQNTIWNHGCK
uniref:Uncharacterized protein LOC114340566 n=1 Tax=Diabrotica virgifera virgifera TaxID=50390 RepID=A0A6P7GCN6_DIAVI